MALTAITPRFAFNPDTSHLIVRDFNSYTQLVIGKVIAGLFYMNDVELKDGELYEIADIMKSLDGCHVQH